MKRLIVAALAFLPCFLLAQETAKYLAGAVPVVDGKVIFTRNIRYSGSQEEVYSAVNKWMEERLAENQNQLSRVVYKDTETKTIVGQSEEYLVFKSSAVSLDRSLTTYRITTQIFPDQVRMEVSNLRYEYQVGNKRDPDKYLAENWITDEMALNKAKSKLAFGSGKFRSATVDLVDKLEASLENSLVRVASVPAQVVTPVQPVIAVQPPVVPVPVVVEPAPVVAEKSPVASNLSGYRRLTPDKIPGNIIKMVGDDWMLITAGNDEQFNMMTASWGGLGVLYGKPVTFCFIHPNRYTYGFMEDSDTYTLTFYTEAYRDVLQLCGTTSGRDGDKVKASGLTPLTTENGSKAFGEAWLIIECRKLVAEPFSLEGIKDEKIKDSRAGQPLHTMYVGEILNVWVK